MARRKTVRELERQLAYARAAQEYRPPQPETGASRRIPRTPVKYHVLSPFVDTTTYFTVQASQPSIQFFGGLNRLGLEEAGTDPTPPRGFKPWQVHASQADASPQRIRAKGSNRPYIRYGKGNRDSGNQYNFNAPISASTLAALDTNYKNVANAIQASLGGSYGRVSISPERLPIVFDGTSSIGTGGGGGGTT